MYNLKFNLEREVHAWCRAIIDEQCAGRDKLDELKDHLHCLVEEGVEQGQSEEAAFVAAIKRMGDSRLISDAYGTNTNLLQKIVAFDRRLPRRLGERFSTRALIGFALGYSVFCAALMLLGSALWPQADSLASWMLVIWFVPMLIATSAPGVREAECRALKRAGLDLSR